MFVLQQILSKCVLLRAVYELDADVAGAMVLFIPLTILHKHTLSPLAYRFYLSHTPSHSPPLHSCPYHIVIVVFIVVIAGAVCEDTKSFSHHHSFTLSSLSYTFSLTSHSLLSLSHCHCCYHIVVIVVITGAVCEDTKSFSHHH